MLVTRSSLKPSRGIVVNDVDLACLYILVESDFLLGGDEDLTVIHVLTPHKLDILRYLALVSIHHMSDVQSVQKFDSLSACPKRPLVCRCEGNTCRTDFDDLVKGVQHRYNFLWRAPHVC